MTNLQDMTEPELHQLAHDIEEELDLRRRGDVEAADAEIAAINARVLAAHGREPGDPWVQPTGYADAYPKDWETTHEGKTWVSNLDGNIWEPGDRGWREKVENGYPEFVQPKGYEDAYNTGDRVMFEGRVYESNIDGNVWSPADAPNRWDLVEDA